MRVIVVGCGRVGASLAYQLYKNGHQVTVIDQNAAAFDNLPLDFRGRTLEGDVLAQNVLHRAEVEEADALAAVTNSDTLNALVAHVARSEYQVARVVARNYDPTLRPLLDAFEIPVVGSAGWGARRIEELLTEAPLSIVFLDNTTNFALYQLVVNEDWHGHSLHELLPEDRGKVVEWQRAGQPVEISGAQILEAGDLLYLSVDPAEIEALRRRLGLRREPLT
jgi:trk system potassium uptake protein TrkA